MAVASQPAAARLGRRASGPSGSPSEPQRKNARARGPGVEARSLIFGTYFVAAVGAGATTVDASVFVVSLFVAPPFFVTFLVVFFTFFLLVGAFVSVVVAVFSVVLPVIGFVVVVALVVWVFASCAKATPSDRTATATRAERVFFILFSSPLFLWPARGLPTKHLAQPRCHARDRCRARTIKSIS